MNIKRGLKHPPSLPAVVALAAQAVFVQAAWAQTSTAVQLDTVEVVGEATNASEVTKSYENPAVSSSTGLLLTKRETPQSVSVITRQQMDDEGAQTIDDALLNATGITATQLDVGSRTTYRSRGYDITNFQVDGAKINGESSFSGQGQSINMDLYDRVELLRGAAGLTGNTGDPSGVINLIRKEPRKNRFGTASVTLGSWNKKHLMLDLNQPLNKEGSVRSRFVISGDDSDGFRDREKSKALGVLASVAADLTSSTKVTVGLQYERNRLNGATWGTNVPIWFADGTTTSFKRSMSAAADWSYSKNETKTAFASLEQKLGNNWTTALTGSITQGESIRHLAVAKANRGGSGGYWSQDGTGAALNTMFAEYETQNRNLAWTLNGPWQLGGQTHQFMAGLSVSDYKQTQYGLNCYDSTGTSIACMNRVTTRLSIADWREFIASGSTIDEITAVRTGTNTVTRKKTYGGYLANRFRITQPLSVIAGTRISWEKRYQNGDLTGEFNHKLTPYLGTVYDINRNYSAYASVTSIYNSQTYQRTDGSFLKPTTGTAYETGVKAEWLDGQIDGSLAVFYTKKKDVAVRATDADGNYAYVLETSTAAYVNGSSDVRTKGFELDFSGRITPSWNVYGGYTYLSVDNPDSPTTDDDPRHLLRLNTSYRLPGAWSKLTLGAGLTSQSKMRQTPTGTSHPTLGSNVNIDLKGYTLYHAMARYEFSKNLVATLNINNLLDKTYYRQYGFYAGGIYGEPRSVKLTLRATF